jgi:hypothetical protein
MLNSYLKKKRRAKIVAHTSNPSYSEGRDQEDCGSKQAWKIVCKILFQKNPTQKNRVGGVVQGISPEFKPQYCEKNKRRKETVGEKILEPHNSTEKELYME